VIIRRLLFMLFAAGLVLSLVGCGVAAPTAPALFSTFGQQESVRDIPEEGLRGEITVGARIENFNPATDRADYEIIYTYALNGGSLVNGSGVKELKVEREGYFNITIEPDPKMTLEKFDVRLVLWRDDKIVSDETSHYQIVSRR
jgi:hypothetical protein